MSSDKTVENKKTAKLILTVNTSDRLFGRDSRSIKCTQHQNCRCVNSTGGGQSYDLQDISTAFVDAFVEFD